MKLFPDKISERAALQNQWLPELLDGFCYLMVTFVSSWQKPRDDTEEKTLDSWDKDELLSAAAGKDICYFFFDAFLLLLGRIVVFDFRSSSTSWKCVKNCLLTILNLYFCQPMKLTMKDFCRRINSYTLTTSSKIQNSVAPLLFSMNC